MMDYEGFSSSRLRGLSVKTTKHKRSKSFPDKRHLSEDKLDFSPDASSSYPLKLDNAHLYNSARSKIKLSSNPHVQDSLKKEIMQLEERLQDQIAVRCAMEKALGYRSSSHYVNSEISMPKPATELIKEISVLELDVMYLEQYLLSLYRKAFDHPISSLSPPTKDDRLKSSIVTPRRRRLEFSRSDVMTRRKNSAVEANSHSIPNMHKESNGMREQKLLDSSVQRCHSALSQRSGLAHRNPPSDEALDKAVRACHSQPLSMMEYAQNTATNLISLAEHLGARISDYVEDTPNRISEDMIKCMCTIYCKLADPPLTNNGLSSPTSSLSSMSAFSPKDQCDLWSPGLHNDLSFDVRLDNPFHVEGLKEFSGPYSTMVEIQSIHRDSQKLGYIEHLLQNFRSFITRLEQIDPKKLTHEEKLAFWINIYNALVMHAFLAYGIPTNNMKRVLLLSKAAYNIGGCIVSTDMLRNSILGSRMSHPGQWLRLLLASRRKFKAGDDRQAYAIERPEPLLHFALCSGCHSDPVVRVYTPKRIFQELETAKEEYIRATFGVQKDQKILLPKVLESFMKDSGLSPSGMMEMIQHTLPESLRKSIKKCQQGKSRKKIEWVPHNFAFRYLIVKDLAK